MTISLRSMDQGSWRYPSANILKASASTSVEYMWVSTHQVPYFHLRKELCNRQPLSPYFAGSNEEKSQCALEDLSLTPGVSVLTGCANATSNESAPTCIVGCGVGLARGWGDHVQARLIAPLHNSLRSLLTMFCTFMGMEPGP